MPQIESHGKSIPVRFPPPLLVDARCRSVCTTTRVPEHLMLEQTVELQRGTVVTISMGLQLYVGKLCGVRRTCGSPMVARKEEVTHTCISLNSTGASGHHRYTHDQRGGRLEAHVGRKWMISAPRAVAFPGMYVGRVFRSE